MDVIEGSKQTGKFTVSPGRDVYGEITLSGGKTALYLEDLEYFDTQAIPGQCLKGVLRDLTKVSLIDCRTPGTGSGYRRGEGYHFAEIFPHFVIYGEQHIDPNEKTIAEVDFVIDDASTLFYDFDAFGTLVDARPFIDQIVQANATRFGRQIKTGPDPQILYFTGEHEIFSVNTVLGKVSALHSPLPRLGGPKGVGLKNRIFVAIGFKEGVTFDDAISRTLILLRYLGILVGRPQNLLAMSLHIGPDNTIPNVLRVYWSMPPERDSTRPGIKPHPSDVLLDAVRVPQQFSRVMSSWLERQHLWHDARLRFYNSFDEQGVYDINRLIASANMFDILPSSAVPPDVQLTDELEAARDAGRRVFDNLPQSPERDSILGALGRIGKSSLKHKIRHRAQFLIAATGTRFSELPMVIDEAVNCRNYYVHGSRRRFDYNNNFDVVLFFTDTLEFVFGTSDLIEAGWDVRSWIETPTSMSHPFAAYRINYAGGLQKLKGLLPPPVVSSPEPFDD
jgi:ApeA-like protein/HEPN superfamily Apea-like protein